MLAELDAEKGIGLIERKKQGQGKPTMIYVKQFTQTDLPPIPSPQDQSEHFRLRESRSQEIEEAEVQTSENPSSRLRETRSADFGQSERNKNNKNQTDFSYTDPSIHLSDGWEIEEQVRDQIDYPLLSVQYPHDDPDCILQLICDVLTSTAETIRIGNENIPTPKVQTRFRRLDFEHVAYVLDSLRETTSKIKNIRAYLLTALYNAPLTIGPYYAAAVRHDFG